MSLYRPFLGGDNSYIHMWGANLCQSYLRAPNLINTSKTGLVSAYDFKDESLADLVGSNDGSIIGNVSFVNSRVGILAKPISGDGCIDFGQIDTSSGAFFASMWYVHDGLPNKYLCGLYESNIENLDIVSGLSGLTIYDDIGGAARMVYSCSLTRGQLCHVIYGIGTDNVLRMWINGKPLANNVSAAKSISLLTSASFTLLSVAGLPAYSILGLAGNLEIFNINITDADAASIYERGKIDADLGPFVETDSLGAGVSIEAPIYELSDADMLRPLNGGRIALSFDVDFPALPEAESTVETDYPILTLYKDEDEYIEIYLQRESEFIA